MSNLLKKSGKKSFVSVFKKAARFLRKEDKSLVISAGAMTSYQSYFTQPGKPVWSRRDYSKFADEGYAKNVVAYRSINLVTVSAASVPLLLYKKEGDKRTEISSHPVLKLLNRPNPAIGGMEFFESIYAYRLISGNSYIQKIMDKDSGIPKELYLLRPDRVSLIAGNDYLPAAYRYSIDNKNYHDFAVNRINGKSDVMHMKNFHPNNDWYGLSPIEAAAYSIDQHNQAAVWNQALLQNGARPSGALVVKNTDNTGGVLSDEQFNRLKSQMDDQYAGAMNAGRPLLLEGGLEWKEMSLNPKDMDFINSKYSSARDIALAFGVPPQLLGIPGDNTYSNLAEARLSLWEQTIIPILENTKNALNNWLLPHYGENLYLDFDLDEVSALTPRREMVWSKLENVSYMTVNEKRHAVGLSPIQGGDKI